MEADTNIGPVVVEELKRQAREQGYVVVALPAAEFWLYVCCAVYFLLGYTLAAR